MPRPAIDLSIRLKGMLQHVHEMPEEASFPLSHYKRTSTDLWNSLQYVEKAFDQVELYAAVMRRHLGRLNAMILVNLIESFERFLKEIAAVTIDHLASFILDDRFDEFPIHGSHLASFYGAGSLGKALCESLTWLKCEEINKRFRKLLGNPFQVGTFYVFPGNNQQPEIERFRLPIMDMVWQIRHSMVHNVGVITQSDAIKLRMLAKEAVHAPCLLLPTRDDLRYLKKFLDETAQSCNQRIGDRLAELLTKLHADDPTLFIAQDKAHALSLIFGVSLTVAGKAGILPPP